MRDIEHRHKQEITLLRSQVSDLKAENLNLKETLEKIDKSQKQQFKQIGKLEREINKLQDIHAKCQSSDQQSPGNSDSEQPPPSDVIDKVSICTSNKYDVLTARSETSKNMFDSLGAKRKRLAQSIYSHINVLELEIVMPVEQTSNLDAVAPPFSSAHTHLSYVKLPSIYLPRESHQSNNVQFVKGNPASIYHPNEQQDQNSYKSSTHESQYQPVFPAIYSIPSDSFIPISYQNSPVESQTTDLSPPKEIPVPNSDPKRLPDKLTDSMEPNDETDFKTKTKNITVFDHDLVMVILMDSNGKEIITQKLYPNYSIKKVPCMTIDKCFQIMNESRFKKEPKIVLLHFGTNDIEHNDQETVTDDLVEIINLICRRLP